MKIDVSAVGSPAVGDTCILVDEDWLKVQTLRVVHTQGGVRVGPTAEVILNPSLATEPKGTLFVSPFSIRFRNAKPAIHEEALEIRDLASSFLRTDRVDCADLVSRICGVSQSKPWTPRFVEACLRCCVASGIFIPKVDKRRKPRLPALELSREQRNRESQRRFAGTVANELSVLSERIRDVIGHASTVGTYREHLLQTVLRRLLPERYHVATGFVYGCERQLDVVIYDRVDHAPIFRGGDLVVVPADAVRAVIEVKTNLNAAEIKDSLQLIEDVAGLDDCNPPFFKGIFGFESRLQSADLLRRVAEFYTAEANDGFELHTISVPYRHLTSVCVLNATAAQVKYEKVSDRWLPVLYSLRSATNMDSQAAHFVDTLLSYLRPLGLPHSGSGAISAMLGFDTQAERVGDLAKKSWGAYFAQDNGLSRDPESEVREFESLILKGEEFLLGFGGKSAAGE